MITLDFETEAIINGSDKSPTPVGLAFKRDDAPAAYIHWGHDDSDPRAIEQAREILLDAHSTGNPTLFHNAKFDVRVALEWFGINFTENEYHDSLFLSFLNDPRDPSLSLKPLSEKYLDMPPQEQDDLRDWLVANVKKATPKNFGAYIARAPSWLVELYAIGDVDRTYALYHYMLGKWASDDDMMKAYQRELAVMPVILDMEMKGITLSDQLPSELAKWESIYADGEKVLQQYSTFDVGKKAFFNDLREKGFIEESKIEYTDKGNARYGRGSLEACISDPVLIGALSNRSKLQKCIGTYLKPWSESYREHGKFFPYFNQVRNHEDRGTKTGRMSSNMQQMPHVTGSKELPALREMIVPDAGEILIKRDFSSQEIRVAAHYAGGKIANAFINDPDLDIHTYMQELILAQTGVNISRRQVKTVTFLKLYAGGPNALSAQLGITYPEAIDLFDAYDQAVPEFRRLSKEAEDVVKSGKLLRTWGGRLYDVEDSKDGRTFYYKMLNILIQGSSADMTKEAMIRYHNHPHRKGRLILQVHDELVATVHPDNAEREMEILAWAMNEIEGWDIPMLSDSATGYSFGTLEET